MIRAVGSRVRRWRIGRLWTSRWRRAINPCPRGRTRACARLQPGVLGGWVFGKSAVAAGSHPRCQYAGAGQCGGRTASAGRHVGCLARRGLGESTRTPLSGQRQPMRWPQHPTRKQWQSYRRSCRTSTTTTSLSGESPGHERRTSDAVAQKRLARLRCRRSPRGGRKSAPTTPPSQATPKVR